jgi:CubicO group peptidase (beta-lactamase class C family)
MLTHGFVDEGFEPVAEAFAANFEDDLELGAGFCAILDDRVVVDLVGGYADRNKSVAWTAATLAPVYSTTKPIAALVVALLVERGALNYEWPVARVWPDFAANGKDHITIAQALSHQAGLVGFPDPINPALWLDPPALAAALAMLAPQFPPGQNSGYHPLTFGYIVGEIVRRASGKSLGAILREDMTAPNGIDFWIGLADAEHARCADMKKPPGPPQLGEITELKRIAFLTKWAAPDRGGADWRRAEIPSANGHGTAKSVAQLYGLYAHRGVLMGARVLSDASVLDLTRLRIASDDLVLPFHCHWAAGVMRNGEGVYGPNPNTLGHSGWGGSCAFGDPDAGLSAAYIMNRQSTALQGDSRAQRLIAALYSCL